MTSGSRSVLPRSGRPCRNRDVVSVSGISASGRGSRLGSPRWTRLDSGNVRRFRREEGTAPAHGRVRVGSAFSVAVRGYQQGVASAIDWPPACLPHRRGVISPVRAPFGQILGRWSRGGAVPRTPPSGQGAGTCDFIPRGKNAQGLARTPPARIGLVRKGPSWNCSSTSRRSSWGRWVSSSPPPTGAIIPA